MTWRKATLVLKQFTLRSFVRSFRRTYGCAVMLCWWSSSSSAAAVEPSLTGLQSCVWCRKRKFNWNSPAIQYIQIKKYIKEKGGPRFFVREETNVPPTHTRSGLHWTTRMTFVEEWWEAKEGTKCDGARTMRTLHENITVHLSLCQIADKAISVVPSTSAARPLHPSVRANHPQLGHQRQTQQQQKKYWSCVVTEYYVVQSSGQPHKNSTDEGHWTK